MSVITLRPNALMLRPSMTDTWIRLNGRGIHYNLTANIDELVKLFGDVKPNPNMDLNYDEKLFFRRIAENGRTDWINY